MIILSRGITTYNLKGKGYDFDRFTNGTTGYAKQEGYFFFFFFFFFRGRLISESFTGDLDTCLLSPGSWRCQSDQSYFIRYFRFCSANRVLRGTSLQTISFVTLCLNYKMPRPKKHAADPKQLTLPFAISDPVESARTSSKRSGKLSSRGWEETQKPAPCSAKTAEPPRLQTFLVRTAQPTFTDLHWLDITRVINIAYQQGHTVTEDKQHTTPVRLLETKAENMQTTKTCQQDVFWWKLCSSW